MEFLGSYFLLFFFVEIRERERRNVGRVWKQAKKWNLEPERGFGGWIDEWCELKHFPFALVWGIISAWEDMAKCSTRP